MARPSKLISYNGETLTYEQWAARLGISRNALQQRFSAGWPIEAALTAPPGDKGRPAYKDRHRRVERQIRRDFDNLVKAVDKALFQFKRQLAVIGDEPPG